MIRSIYRSLSPGWKGALFGLLIATALTWAWAAYDYFPAEPHWLSALGWTLAGFLFTTTIALVLLLAGWLLSRLPRLFLILTIVSILLLVYSIWLYTSGLDSFLLRLFLILIGSSLVGGAIAILARREHDLLTKRQRALWIFWLVLGGAGVVIYMIWLFVPGSTTPYYQNIDAAALTAKLALDIPDPSLPGNYRVNYLTYGSGRDRRLEYGAEADLKTKSVDGSAFISAWERQRTSYWGFDQTSLPLNGRVAYPDAPGSFPLVLIIHGNRSMEVRSELGFDYLCELFASRGTICASIDENFFNNSSAVIIDALTGITIPTPIGDNQARAWLALEHLKLFRQWETDANTPFYQRIDMENIALIGHSMGGEAVAIASEFNRMPNYYDDGLVPFDYNFSIRTTIALAPVDNIYHLGGDGVEQYDTNYLVLHGTTDGDVFSFLGLGQYQRSKFSGNQPGIKASLYIDKANHSQFNTQWGSLDTHRPASLFQNNAQNLSAEEQRQIAKVYLSAFLDLTLKSRPEYLPLFADHRSAGDWIPETIYLNQLQTASFRTIGDFEEDANLHTTTLAAGLITQDGLVSWNERSLQGKIPLSSHDSRAVFLGWDGPAVYRITLPKNFSIIDPLSNLIFSLTDAAEDPHSAIPLRPTRKAREPIDLTIELVDQDGDLARLALSHFSLLQPQIQVLLGKVPSLDGITASELVPQSFIYALEDFQKANPDFDPTTLAEIRFVFDRTDSGVVALDNIGLQMPALR